MLKFVTFFWSDGKFRKTKWLCNLILALIEALSNPINTSRSQRYRMLRSEKYSQQELIYPPFHVCFVREVEKVF